MLNDDNMLATGIGLIVLAVLVVAWALMRGPLAGIALSDPRIHAAVIGGVFALIGIMLSTTMTLLIGWWKERKERNAVAASILAELLVHARAVADCMALADRHAQTNSSLVKNQLDGLMPPEPMAYRALASRLPMLKHDVSKRIVDFFSAVDVAKKQSGRIKSFEDDARIYGATSSAHSDLRASHNIIATKEIAEHWRRAAAAAQGAIASLRKASSLPQQHEKSTDALLALLEHPA